MADPIRSPDPSPDPDLAWPWLHVSPAPPFFALPLLQQGKLELSQDNATLQATLRAASHILSQVLELLRGMDEAKEVRRLCSQGSHGLTHRQNWVRSH